MACSLSLILLTSGRLFPKRLAGGRDHGLLGKNKATSAKVVPAAKQNKDSRKKMATRTLTSDATILQS